MLSRQSLGGGGSDFRRPGGDLLSHALRRSTIGAEGFHGRVRDGIGCRTLAMTTRPAKIRAQKSEVRGQNRMVLYIRPLSSELRDPRCADKSSTSHLRFTFAFECGVPGSYGLGTPSPVRYVWLSLIPLSSHPKMSGEDGMGV